MIYYHNFFYCNLFQIIFLCKVGNQQMEFLIQERFFPQKDPSMNMAVPTPPLPGEEGEGLPDDNAPPNSPTAQPPGSLPGGQ